MSARIMPCDCEHEYQDQHYGKRMRLFNNGFKVKGSYKCTVCGKTKIVMEKEAK